MCSKKTLPLCVALAFSLTAWAWNDDLEWKFEGDTNRAPAQVISPAVVSPEAFDFRWKTWFEQMFEFRNYLKGFLLMFQ